LKAAKSGIGGPCLALKGLAVGNCVTGELDATARSATPPRTLEELAVGGRARVLRVGGSGALRTRLMEMGLVAGAQVTLVKAAPLGDPLQIRVRGYDLALRRAEARLVELVLPEGESR
jgi:Fe2+ transport system protein FeoA